jgi:ribonuclease P protein subunit POP4
MTRTKNNILYSTFIGLQVEIVNSSQHDLVGLKGKVTDETKNLLVIEKTDGKEVKIPKVSCTFRFTLDDGSKFDIEGMKITFRPEERPKKV